MSDMWDDSDFRHVGEHPIPVMASVKLKGSDENEPRGLVVNRWMIGDEPWYEILWSDGALTSGSGHPLKRAPL